MTAQLDPVAPAESVLYRYLTEGFSTPNAARLEYLSDMVSTVAAACEELLETNPAGPALPDPAGLEQAIAAARAGSLEELQAEYTRLFVLGIPATPCRLVEAVQREHALVGEATEEVAGFYLRFGLAVSDREPDHLTSELEFLTYLTGTPVAAGKETERYRRARIKFLNEHLLKWAPGVTAKIRTETTVPLYRSLAGLMDFLLDTEGAVKV